MQGLFNVPLLLKDGRLESETLEDLIQLANLLIAGIIALLAHSIPTVISSCVDAFEAPFLISLSRTVWSPRFPGPLILTWTFEFDAKPV